MADRFEVLRKEEGENEEEENGYVFRHGFAGFCECVCVKLKE